MGFHDLDHHNVVGEKVDHAAPGYQAFPMALPGLEPGRDGL